MPLMLIGVSRSKYVKSRRTEMGELLARWTMIPLVLAPFAFSANPLWAETAVSVMLHDIDSGLTSPQGQYRWMDVADQVYDIDFFIETPLKTQPLSPQIP